MGIVPKGKNRIGFTQEQLEVILSFCKKAIGKPRIPFSDFHRKYSPYSRRCTTSDIIRRAYKRKVIFGPILFCNNNIDVELIHTSENPLHLFQEKKNDPKTTFLIGLYGDWSCIVFRKGANSLQYMNNIIPESLSNNKLEAITFDEKGKLEMLNYPHGWEDIDWKIYEMMRQPRNLSFMKVGQNLGTSWKSVKEHYEKIMVQCRAYMSFFPLGHKGYNYLFVTFRTKYEIGVEKALEKLDRTSFLYKTKNMIILVLFTSLDELSYNRVTARFSELEEIGIIHDLRACIPICWQNMF